ncbi:unnamed protein product [Arabidopsis thaliana]|uniref:(thale cress) hypothetical protein n=1 Tax=Arabidopsis thaliana TaxID=3702 RepID=A0A7G2FBZ8_ARATH|nr:unnamed protein product [Arabidopsis thaliana]
MHQDMVLLTLLNFELEAAKDLRKALSEAEARNLELATELETVTRKLDQLQESAARDTGALREAKEKQQELEEAKTQEYAKQQEALQAMRLQVEEANAAVVREREAARKAIEEAPPVIKEIPVLVEDTEKINSLTSEVEALKTERQAAEHLKKAFSEAEARNSELATELENASRKADQLQESAARDTKALTEAKDKLEERVEEVTWRLQLEKRQRLGKTKVFLRAGQMAELDARRAEVLGNAARRIQRQSRTFIACKEFRALRGAAIVLQSNCRGKLACNLYEEMRRQAAAVKIQKIFRRHIARESYLRIRHSTITVQTALRGMVARNEFRFRKQMKAATIIQARLRSHLTHSYYKQLQKAALSTQCGWRSRVARKELRTLNMAARDTGALREAKDKLEKRVEELTWRLQLEKRQRSELEEAKTQEYAKQQEALQAMRLQVEEANAAVVREREAAKKAIEEAPPVIKEIPVLVEDTEKINSLTSELEALKAERQAAEHLIKEAFMYYFNVLEPLWGVILRRECCSFSYGEYVKAGLAELEQWCIEATDEFAGSAWDELRHIRQAVDFLVIHQKPKLSLDEITRLFPVLTIRQLFRISTKYWDNKYGTHSVSSDVIEKIRVMMTEDSDESGSFLLEDDSSIIPFIVEDISMSMEQVNVNDIELPQLILENPCFSFLLTREEGNPS